MSSINSCFPVSNYQNSSPIYENVSEFVSEEKREVYSDTCISEERDDYSLSSLDLSCFSLDSLEISSENSAYFEDKWKHSYSNNSTSLTEFRNTYVDNDEMKTVPCTNHKNVNFSQKLQNISFNPPSKSELNLRHLGNTEQKYKLPHHFQQNASPSLKDCNYPFYQSSFEKMADNKLSVCCRYPSCYNTLINCKIHAPPERDTTYSVKHIVEDKNYVNSDAKYVSIATNILENAVLDNKSAKLLTSKISTDYENVVSSNSFAHEKYPAPLQSFDSSYLQPNSLPLLPDQTVCHASETMSLNARNYESSYRNEERNSIFYDKAVSDCSNSVVKNMQKGLDPFLFKKISSSNVLDKENTFSLPEQKFLDEQLEEIVNKTVYSFYCKSMSSLNTNKSSLEKENDLLIKKLPAIKKDQIILNTMPYSSKTPHLSPPSSNTEIEVTTSEQLSLPSSLHDNVKILENECIETKCHDIELVHENQCWDSQCSIVNSATQTASPCIKKKLESGNVINNLSSYNEELSSEVGSKTPNRKKSVELETSVLERIQKQTQRSYINSSNLPITSAYFTTSVPKAKLLTRHTSKLTPTNVEAAKEYSLQKNELISSIARKLDILLQEQTSLREELRENDALGNSLIEKLEEAAKPVELQKFRLHIEEYEKITNLLSSLSGRLVRAENALLFISPEASSEKKVLLEEKCKLKLQYSEALQLQKNIEKRNEHLSVFLHKYLTNDDLADYDHFIKMKVKLLSDYKELVEKIKLGEEQLSALKNTLETNVQINK